jgi:hypothetical protein
MSSAGMVIPLSERYPGLKKLVFQYVDLLVIIRKRHPNLISQQQTTFFLLAYPWLADYATFNTEQASLSDQRKKIFKELGFDGEVVATQLKEILTDDKHLANCCNNVTELAHYLDTSLLTPLATATINGVPKERLDFAYDEFESTTYHQGSFKRILVTHLFNFDMDGDSAFLGDIRIERIALETIPRILGETGFHAFLHPPHVGNCFIVEEEGPSPVDDFTWMVAKREKAIRFAQLLQYYKDGVVYAGYSSPHFSPEWVNQIRKWGLFFLGNTRQVPYENGSKHYFMTSADRDNLVTWWNIMKSPKIAAALENRSGKLRAATYRAAEYYELSHERLSPVERLIALAIALESLFSPSDKGELRFRIAQAAAQFVGKDPAERIEIFESLKEMYDKRSSLFHGSYDLKKYEEGTFVTANEIDKWSGYIRRSYMGFLTLYLRGETSRDSILELINAANFDSAKGEELRKKADIQQLVAELTENLRVNETFEVK